MSAPFASLPCTSGPVTRTRIPLGSYDLLDQIFKDTDHLLNGRVASSKDLKFAYTAQHVFSPSRPSSPSSFI